MEKKDFKNVNARVYRRGLEDIIILWNTKTLNESQKSLIQLSVYEEQGQWRELKFIADNRRERIGHNCDRDTAIAIIPYKENELNADSDYRIKITLGSGIGVLNIELEVYRFGTLPNSIKDDAKCINQMYGYMPGERKWKKIPLIERNGILGIPVFIMNLEELQKKHNNK